MRTMGDGESRWAGMGYALAAYGWWGVVPAYWKLFGAVPPFEIVAHRVVWSLLFALLWIGVLRRFAEVRAVLRDPRRALALCASGALIALNWSIFIWAVTAGRIVEASIGYYLNPLVSVGLGVLLLGERLRRAQVAAIACAGAGVAVLGLGSGAAPWIPLALAGTFALYGLVRKLTAVSSLVGLFVETAAATPFALALLVLLAQRGDNALVSGDARLRALIVGSGAMTALPLLWFARAARRLPLSTLGLFQYLAPTLSALLAVVAYGEPFDRTRAVALACIWLGIGVFSVDSLRAADLRRSPRPELLAQAQPVAPPE
jgi:chloramphenicol-sensitive protein RarD